MCQPSGTGPPPAVLQQHLQRIAALESEVQRLRRLQRISGSIITSQLRTPATPDRRGSPMQDTVTPIAMVAEGVAGEGDHSEDLAAEEQAYRYVWLWVETEKRRCGGSRGALNKRGKCVQ